MRHTVYCVLCVLATLTVGILAARYVAHLWILAFFESLQTHFSLVAIALALIALFFKRHWYAVLMLAAGVALCVHSVVMLKEFAAAPAAETSSAQAKNFKLLSFNIENDNFENGVRIADFILASQADVVEIFEAEPLLSQMDRITQLYPYRIGCGSMTPDCDSLLLSKRPFRTQEIRSMGGLWSNRFILANIDMDGQPVNFVTTHLSKPYFDDFHENELDLLAQRVNSMSGPVILAGDFNASVIAPDMREFLAATGLRHVFPEPATWPIEAGAYGISIDHVFARPPLQLISVKQIPDAMGSNHFGLMTEFNIPR